MSDDATTLLRAVRNRDAGAFDALLQLVQGDLHRRARALLAGERANHSLQATALVNEAYLRLVRQDAAEWQDRAHFLAVAARAMRCILVDHARAKKREKRGGGREGLPLDAALLEVETSAGGVDLESLDEALRRLAEIAPRAADVVERRFFGGMTHEEIAAALDTSLSTVEREWRYARAWLLDRLGEGGNTP